MNDTPMTNRVIKNCNGWHHVPVEYARQLERELNAANERISHLIQLGLETSQYGLTKHREMWEKEWEV